MNVYARYSEVDTCLWQSQQVLIIYFAEIRCTLSEANLATSPSNGECTTSSTNWGEECEIKCKSGYALGTAIVTGNKHRLKCQGATVATGAWKQKDNPNDDPPTCQRKSIGDSWYLIDFLKVFSTFGKKKQQ